MAARHSLGRVLDLHLTGFNTSDCKGARILLKRLFVTDKFLIDRGYDCK